MHSLVYQNTLMTETQELWDFKEWMKSAWILWWRRWCYRSRTREKRQHWYEHSGMCLQMCWCASPSLTLYFMCICVPCLPPSWQTQWCQSCVCVSPGNVTDRVLRETDLVSPSGLHAANGVCQSTSWQLLVPPTVSVYPEPSEKYVLMDQSLKSARAEAGCRNSHWTKKTNKMPQRLNVELTVTLTMQGSGRGKITSISTDWFIIYEYIFPRSITVIDLITRHG